MKRTNDNTRFAELFVKAGLVAAIAAVLLAPMTARSGDDQASHKQASHVEDARPMLKRASWNPLPLPPIPHLETMPWLNPDRAERAGGPMKIDTLLAPAFELMAPAVVVTAADARCASTPGLAGKG